MTKTGHLFRIHLAILEKGISQEAGDATKNSICRKSKNAVQLSLCAKWTQLVQMRRGNQSNLESKTILIILINSSIMFYDLQPVIMYLINSVHHITSTKPILTTLNYPYNRSLPNLTLINISTSYWNSHNNYSNICNTVSLFFKLQILHVVCQWS